MVMLDTSRTPSTLKSGTLHIYLILQKEVTLFYIKTKERYASTTLMSE
jgi:hypothetical protein